MPSKTFTEIVDNLTPDRVLIDKWEEFSYALHLSPDVIAKLELEYSKGALSVKGIFMKIIESWTSINDAATVEYLCEVLRNLEANRAADALLNLIANIERPVKIQQERREGINRKPFNNSVSFGVEKPVKNYIPRPAEEEKLLEYYRKSQIEQEADDHRPVCVYGFGGTGKTQLVKRFLEKQELSTTSKIWLPSESLPVLKHGIIALAIEFKILSNHSLSLSIDWLFGKICSQLADSKCIFVFDNVEKEFPELSKILNKILALEKSFVIMTSRLNTFGGRVLLLPLKGLEDSQANAFVKANLEENADDSSIKNFCKRLDNLPLALQLSIAYINQERKFGLNFGILQFLEKFSSDSSVVLEEGTEIPYTLSLVVSDIMQKLRSQIDGHVVIRVMQIISILQPDNLSLRVLKHLCVEDNELFYPSQLDHALYLLKKYGLITFKASHETIFIHRITQKIAGEYFTKSELPVNFISRILERDILYCTLPTKLRYIMEHDFDRQFMEDLVHLDYLNNTKSYSTFTFGLQYVLFPLNVICVILIAALSLAYPPPVVAGRIVFWISAVICGMLITVYYAWWSNDSMITKGNSLERRGLYDEASDYYWTALIRSVYRFWANEKVLKVIFFIGRNYLRSGKYIDGIKWLEYVLQKRIRLLSSENEEIIVNKVYLAEAHYRAGNLEKAKELLMDVFSKRDSYPTIEFLFVEQLLSDLNASSGGEFSQFEAVNNENVKNKGQSSFWKRYQARLKATTALLTTLIVFASCVIMLVLQARA